MGDNTLISERN